LIVGAGLAGSILAYRARKAGKSVFVADTLRRWQLKPQITMYDFIDIAPID
jgi:flavin-dependent dehydrogenase